MGWDAYSEPFNTNWGLDNPNIGDRAWDEVVADLHSRNIMIDGLLPHGGLDISTCGLMLSAATGESVYGDPWSPEKVKELSLKANWDLSPEKIAMLKKTGIFEDQLLWANENAKVFLNHCAKLGRGIRFSW